MKYLLILLCSCAAQQQSLVPTPEQMPEGRVVCRALCSSVGRDYLEYQYDGKCVCKPENKLEQM